MAKKNLIKWNEFGRVMVFTPHLLGSIFNNILFYLKSGVLLYPKGAGFIDAANVIFSLRSLGWKIDYKKLYGFFRDNCHLQDIYFYTSIRRDNKKDQQWVNMLRRFGYITKIRFLKLFNNNNKIELKGNLDGYIFVDALDKLDNYDTCFLFSGDSDFEVLIDYLREKNKQVIVCSCRKNCSWELRRKADKYLSLQYFRGLSEYKKTARDKPGTV